MRRNNFGQQYQFPTPHITKQQQQHQHPEQQQHQHPQQQQHPQHQQLQHNHHHQVQREQKSHQQNDSSNPNLTRQHSGQVTSPFLIENFDQPSFSGYQRRVPSFLSHGKRKSDSDNTFHPRTKQQITEERITTSMQQLSLTVNNPSRRNLSNHQNTTNRTIDEGFFEEVNHSSSDEELDVDNQESTLWNGSKFKQLYFTPGIKESLKKFDEDILPQQILHEIQCSSLALVPYKPPAEIANLMLDTKNEKFNIVCQRNVTNTFDQKYNVKGEMDVDEENEEKPS